MTRGRMTRNMCCTTHTHTHTHTLHTLHRPSRGNEKRRVCRINAIPFHPSIYLSQLCVSPTATNTTQFSCICFLLKVYCGEPNLSLSSLCRCCLAALLKEKRGHKRSCKWIVLYLCLFVCASLAGTLWNILAPPAPWTLAGLPVISGSVGKGWVVTRVLVVKQEVKK